VAAAAAADAPPPRCCASSGASAGRVPGACLNQAEWDRVKDRGTVGGGGQRRGSPLLLASLTPSLPPGRPGGWVVLAQINDPAMRPFKPQVLPLCGLCGLYAACTLNAPRGLCTYTAWPMCVHRMTYACAPMYVHRVA
jgi:hypothetical protein